MRKLVQDLPPVPRLGVPVPSDYSEDSPDQGALFDDEGEPVINEDGEIADLTEASSGGLAWPAESPTSIAPNGYSLCVNVDWLGPETNSAPIPITGYAGTLSVTGPDVYSQEMPQATDTPVYRADNRDARMVASGTIGTLSRNGTSVKIAYLTVSDKYNQRLIVSNRSNRDAFFDLSGFTTEEGTSVELSAAAQAAREADMNVIPARGQVVLRVADLLEFSGDRARTAATLSVNAHSGNIQVATTQVNLEDGSTDTVVYMAERGLGIEQ